MSTIIDRLSKHVADMSVFYTKLHNYHWHVSGLEFMPTHVLTEGYYEGITENYDALAERIVQLGSAAPASLKEYLALATIKEEPKKSFAVKEVLSAVKADFEYLIAELRATQKMAADSGDCTTDSIITDIIADYEKKLWMLNASLK
ncbi:MAG: Dps family protein [Treponema sp.]